MNVLKWLWKMSRRGKYKTLSTPRTKQSVSSDEQARILAYALPNAPDEQSPPNIVDIDNVKIADFPIGHDSSFLDYDVVVLYAGAFEDIEVYGRSHTLRYFSQDLDRRHREFFTMLKNRKVFIFLLTPMTAKIDYAEIDPQIDLFRRVAKAFGLNWKLTIRPLGHLSAAISDFTDFMDRHGTAHLKMEIPYDLRDSCKAISAINQNEVAGFCFQDRVFFLPARIPKDHADALQIAARAVKCVVKYRRRISEDLPDWVSEFTFLTETTLRNEAKDLESQLFEMYGQIEELEKLKGVLCHQSTPLVKAVCDILRSVFKLKLDDTDEFIEDIKILGDDDEILAMVEVKGVTRSFTREDVNQVDSHRERRELSAETPSILIMNTMRNANSLAAKDERPHPDVIKKAVSDNVLMIRTIDLLRYINAVQSDRASVDDFRKIILSERGWLEVGDEVIVHKD